MVCGRKIFRPYHICEGRLTPTQPWVKALRRTVAYLLIAYPMITYLLSANVRRLCTSHPFTGLRFRVNTESKGSNRYRCFGK
ncbi:MAG: hypothetical protein LBU34_09925 [Planctomycetaceae bacterium]|nr:hypothetical protein [Planctomycetaceae bacterium]